MDKIILKRISCSGPVLRPIRAQFFKRYKLLPFKEWYDFCHLAVRRRN